MTDCVFCLIAAGAFDTGFAYEDEHLVVFPDLGSIRRGHVQIVPREHHETFDVTPPDLAAHILHVGQRLARVQKRLYGVERATFMFSGGDIRHVHAHLIPMVRKTDVTSARYIAEQDLTFRPLPDLSPETRRAIASEIGDALSEETRHDQSPP